MIALLAHGLASPLGPADIAGPALAAGLSRAERLAHAPVLGLGEDAAPAVGHAVLDKGDHEHRCRLLLDMARTELGACQPDAVLLCRPLADPLRWGPDGMPSLPCDEQFALGHAAPAAALLRADELIASRACRRVLIAGVDSLLDPLSLAWLASTDRLRGPETPDGVAPGEAAACWLVGPAEPAALAQIVAGYQPAGPRSAVADAERWLRAAGDAPRGSDWVDLTGEPWRARAWGRVAHRLGRTGEHTPADGWGDLGSATLLAAGCVAERPAMLWSLADDGAAGVVRLS
jgi:hypothetical protein